MTEIPTKMTAEMKARWIAALSPGGSHRDRKGRGSLIDCEGRMCCLGVLADMNGAKWGDHPDEQNTTGERVCQFSDPTDADAFLEPDAFGLSEDVQGELAKLNDASDTFDPVIQLIEDIVEAAQ